MPQDERPRERLLRLGAGALSAAELLALLLGSGNAEGRSALGLAQALLAHYGRAGAGFEPGNGALASLGSAGAIDLSMVPGIGPAKACRIVAGLELGRRAAGARISKPAIRSPQDVVDLVCQHMRLLDREHFMALLLDTKNQLLASELIAVGSLDASLVHPREIFKAAVRYSAAAVILLHNHPSGDPTPSEADINCTRRLVEAGRVLGIGILDHIIIGDGRFVSCRESGIGGLWQGVQ